MKAEHRKSTTWSLRSVDDGLEVRNPVNDDFVEDGGNHTYATYKNVNSVILLTYSITSTVINPTSSIIKKPTFIQQHSVPPKPPRPTHRVMGGPLTPGSTPNLSHMLNSVAPPPPAHSSWGSINVGHVDGQPSHAASPVIHFPHAPPTELYTFEEEPALYEAQEAFAPTIGKTREGAGRNTK